MADLTISTSNPRKPTAFNRFLTFFIRGGYGTTGLTTPEVGDQTPGGGTLNAQNPPIDSAKAMTLSAVWSCVRLITEVVASLPIDFYIGESGNREKHNDNNIASLLRNRPNEYNTPQEFKEAMTLQLVLQGNAYAYIHRNSKGTILSLDILPSERIQVIRNEQGTVLYVYSGDKNDKKVFQSSEIFHLKGFGPNGLMGLSVLSYARSSMQLGLNAEEYGKDFFGKGAKPSGVLMVDRVLSPEQRLAIKNNFEDLANNPDAARLWVLEANMKYEQISINPDDAQFISSRAFQTSDIARFFRVPSFLINDSTQNTTWGSGLEQTNLSFLQYTLRPYLMRWEQVIRKCLLDNQPDTKGQNIICEVNVEGLLRADSAGRASFYSTMVQNGLFSRNEVRAKENLPPVEGGDLLTAQLNLAPISELANWHEKTDTKIQGDPNAAKVD